MSNRRHREPCLLRNGPDDDIEWPLELQGEPLNLKFGALACAGVASVIEAKGISLKPIRPYPK
jgi:hypothetical protein